MARIARLRSSFLIAGVGLLAAVSTVTLGPSAAVAGGITTTTTTLSGTVGAVTGQSVTFTAIVHNGTFAPGGSVTFGITGSDGSTPTCDVGADTIGTDTISVTPKNSGTASQAQCTFSGGLLHAASPYMVTASYSGDANDTPSSATTLVQTIDRGPTTTTVSASSSSTPLMTGQPVTFTATVTPDIPASVSPTMSVTFAITGNDGSTINCDGGNDSIALGGGDTASCPVSGGLLAAASPYQVVASYSKDDNFAASSGDLSQAVSRGPATVTVTSSENPVVTGQPVTYTATATIGSPAVGSFNGTVDFSVVSTSDASVTATCQGGNSVPLIGPSGSSAQCTVDGPSSKQLGYSVTATLHDLNFKAAGPGTLTEQVDRDTTTTNITSVPGAEPSTQTFSIVAAVISQDPGGGTPAGVVDFAICPQTGTCTAGGAVSLQPAAVVTSGTPTNTSKARFVVDGGTLTPGYYAVTATYEGNAGYHSSESSTSYIVIEQSATAIELYSSGNPSPSGNQVVFKAAVLPNQQTDQDPTGTVTFVITGASGDSLACANGNTVTISTNSQNQGLATCKVLAGQLTSSDSPYTVEATYSGDSNYEGSQAQMSQTVQ